MAGDRPTEVSRCASEAHQAQVRNVRPDAQAAGRARPGRGGGRRAPPRAHDPDRRRDRRPARGRWASSPSASSPARTRTPAPRSQPPPTADARRGRCPRACRRHLRRAVRHRLDLRRTRRSCPPSSSGRTSSARRCKALEDAAGADIRQLADDGKVKLLYRPTTFLDDGQRRTRPAIPNSSARATSAWGCAIDAGTDRPVPLHASSPTSPHRGRGLLRPAADRLRHRRPAIPGRELATFTTCVQDGTYLAWSANSQQTFLEANVSRHADRLPQRGRARPPHLADIDGLTQKIAARDREVTAAACRRLDPEPGPVGLVPGPGAAPGVRDLHPRRHLRGDVGRRTGAGCARGGAQGPDLRRGDVGGAVRHRRRAALPRGHRLADLLRPGRGRAWRGAARSGRAGWASGAPSRSAASAPGSAAAGRASRCRRSATRWRSGCRWPRRSAGSATGSTRSCSAGPTDLPWGLEIDPEHRPRGLRAVRDLPPHLPLRGPLAGRSSPALVAWADRRWRLGHGRAFALYVALYCVGRLGIELLRIDPATHVGGIRINVITAVVVGVGALVYIVRQRPDGDPAARRPSGLPVSPIAEPAEHRSERSPLGRDRCEPSATIAGVSVGLRHGVASIPQTCATLAHSWPHGDPRP